MVGERTLRDQGDAHPEIYEIDDAVKAVEFHCRFRSLEQLFGAADDLPAGIGVRRESEERLATIQRHGKVLRGQQLHRLRAVPREWS